MSYTGIVTFRIAKSVHTIDAEKVEHAVVDSFRYCFTAARREEDSQERFLVVIKLRWTRGASPAENRKRSRSALKASPLELYGG